MLRFWFRFPECAYSTNYCYRDIPDTTQSKGESTFILEELNKLFVGWRLRNYLDITATGKIGNPIIGGTPPPTLWDFVTIPQIHKGKTIYHPTNYLQRVHI